MPKICSILEQEFSAVDIKYITKDIFDPVQYAIYWSLLRKVYIFNSDDYPYEY